MDTFPALTGSQKQIDWAIKIRAEALAQKGNQVSPQLVDFDEKQLAVANKAGVSREELAQMFAGVHAAEVAARQELIDHTDAKWWIDNRLEGLATKVYLTRMACKKDVMAKLGGK